MSGKRVLIIDDEPLIRRALADYFTEAGYSARTAGDGLQGIGLARAESFDVVLVDLRMPHLGGLEVISTLRAEQPRLPIIVVSGAGVLSDVVEAIRRGAWDYVTKPIRDLDELMVVVERVLEKAQLIAERDRYQQELETLNRSLQAEVERQTYHLRAQNRELTLLNRVIGAATATAEVSALLALLCRELALTFEVERTFAVLCKARHLTGVVAEYPAPGEEARPPLEVAQLQPLVDRLWDRPAPWLLTAETAGLAETASAGFAGGLSSPESSLLLMPLQGRERILSVVGLLRHAAQPYREEELALLHHAVAAAAQALEVVMLRQELEAYAEGLEQAVAHRTAELQAALQQARAAAEAKSQFLSNVSHELRTPLTSIRLYVGLLKRGEWNRYLHYVENLEREVDRLQTLIEGLLDLSRLDLGRIPVHWQAVNLNRVLGELVRDRERLFIQRGLELRLMLAPALPLIQADPRLLEQVAANLLTNALNYTPAPGLVQVRTAVERVGDQQWVTFSVQDNGPGIPPEEQAHLFERFFRGKAAQAYYTPGTGLGLAICQELVQLHHGKITLTSALGQGSTFTVWLPGELTTPMPET